MPAFFASPSNEYRSIPFWSWNCRVSPELIDGDLDAFVKMGFGGVCIHPRAGLDIEYLSDGFFDLVEYAVMGCERRGLVCWLYDDERFPSGIAGGLVTKGGEHEGKYLILSEEPRPDPVAAWGLHFSGDTLLSYRRLTTEAEISRALENRTESRCVRFAGLASLPHQSRFNGSAYIDTTDPAAARAFIALTHERYFARLGKYFGKTVQAIFTDEPRVEPLRQGAPDHAGALSHGDFAAAYTENFAARFASLTGLDPLDVLPDLIWASANPAAPGLRRRYRQALSEAFTSGYMEPIGAWCASHNIMSTGHILGEETLGSQTPTVGEAMACYESMDIPGYDVLIDQRNYAAARQVSSIATQLKKSGVMCELYGSTGWECDFLTYKLQGDRQLALGATRLVPHLAHMSLEGEAKRDWPGSIFTQSPWWERFRLLEDHFARVNLALSRGKRVTRLALIHPVETWWEYPVTDYPGDGRRELSRSFDSLVNALVTSLLDVELVSESMLERGLTGLSRFEAVIVPPMAHLRPSTLNALSAFPGEIIRSESNGDILSQAEKYRDVLVTRRVSRSDLLYTLRSDGERRLLFICHTGDGGAGPEDNDIAVRGAYLVRLLDTMTGEESIPDARVRDGFTHVSWRANPEDSILLELTPAGPDSAPAPDLASSPEAPSPAFPASPAASGPAPVPKPRLLGIALSEPNVLLLDRARFSLDGSPLSEPMDILRLDNAVRARLGYEPRREDMRQPWATAPGEPHDLLLTFEFTSALPFPSLTLALERPEEQEIALNGVPATPMSGHFIDRSFRLVKLIGIGQGRNTLTLRRAFTAKTNPEAVYLLGDFTVSGGVLAAPRPLTLGDIVPQGFPHYTGNLTFTFLVDVPLPGQYSLVLPAFAAPLAEVSLDGGKSVPILSPNPIGIGHLLPGEHTLAVTIYGSRYNLLGALHNADTQNPWRGPDSFRTEGRRWTDEHLTKPLGLLAPPRLLPSPA